MKHEFFINATKKDSLARTILQILGALESWDADLFISAGICDFRKKLQAQTSTNFTILNKFWFDSGPSQLFMYVGPEILLFSWTTQVDQSKSKWQCEAHNPLRTAAESFPVA